MKDVIKIYLPNGKVYKMVLKTDKLDDDAVTSIRRLFSRAENLELELEVEVDPLESKSGLKHRTLILWGENLKNCHVIVERF